MTVELTKEEKSIMEHAVGWTDGRQRLYRNHYAAAPDCDAWIGLQSLVNRGLMRLSRNPSDLTGGMSVFSVTSHGLLVLKQNNAEALFQEVEKLRARVVHLEGSLAEAEMALGEHVCEYRP
jgi:hypothetical protein